MKTRFLQGSGLIIVLIFVGCGSTQLPEQNYAPAQAIAAAQERDVDDNPEAKLHLKLAQDQLAKAESLRAEGEEDQAKLQLIKAQSDADYALALLRRDDAREEAKVVKSKIRELRQDMESGEESL